MKNIKLLFFCICFPIFVSAQSVKIVTNHVGYEFDGAKKAIIVAGSKLDISSFKLIDTKDNKEVYSGQPVFKGPVDKWKNFQFWTMDFSSFATIGTYKLQIPTANGLVSSYPFVIGKNVLEQATLSDVIYYFKEQRSSGLLDKADRHSHLQGKTDTVDAHGGWYDATGDYGKHLSHLSFSSYFNPQQISLTDYSLFKTFELLSKRPGTDFRQFNRRILDEAMYGADYLCRMQAKNGAFYRSVGAPGPGKLPQDRAIGPEGKSYLIKVSKNDDSFKSKPEEHDWRSFQCSFRSGGGMSIAALAMASTYTTSGDYSNADYLKAAENAFDFLDKNNVAMTNDGKENILDDYCALTAATELYKATKKEKYKAAAKKRTLSLINRLSSWKNYKDFWRADDKDRPFFHPSDAGLPVTSLVYYYPYADVNTQSLIKKAIKQSMTYELSITSEVNNPFGYSRQLVQDTLGNRRSSFFFPHGSDASPWWQGENARLGSEATAARLAANLFTDDKAFHDKLENFAIDQLNWILGLNPFDSCMLEGVGHNNPAYGFFGTFEYTNAPGGIVNGVTSGFDNEDDIDFNLPYSQTGKDADWRWAEQWLPHAAWYMLAVAVR
ncbi:glycoside hydrolase family 9 protein [Mucilaginibacter sp. McL0603]|uniref:glycoside hydrolase family 9 protein n=1 Tax=Mucilaginibacter sp. McL0603 TaxID=3415670 RepID=UPI003CEB92BE